MTNLCLDAETALLLDCVRERRRLVKELFDEPPPPPKPERERAVPAPGYREVGMARFRAVRRVKVK